MESKIDEYFCWSLEAASDLGQTQACCQGCSSCSFYSIAEIKKKKKKVWFDV